MNESQLLLYVEGKLSEKESDAVEQWAAQSEDNRRLLEQIFLLHQLETRLNSYDKADTVSAIERFRSHTDL